jgi:hypothetical protein
MASAAHRCATEHRLRITGVEDDEFLKGLAGELLEAKEDV